MSQLTEKNWSRWKSHSPFISLDVGAKAARWCPCKKKKNKIKSEAQQYTDSNALRLLKDYCAFIAIMSFSFFFPSSFPIRF